MRAVRFDGYGDVNVLEVREVEDPRPGPGRVVLRMRAAGINPGESAIRSGALHERWPSTFPSGQGSDLAGVIDELGEGVAGVAVGDEVIAWSDERSSQAELVEVPAEHLTPRPAAVSWEQAGALFVAGATAWACVRAVNLGAGDTVVVAGAAGGVGSILVQLARLREATVIGLASDSHHEWLSALGVIPVTYGDGVADRIRAAADGRVDAFIDLFGGGYADLAVQLGVSPSRINTIIDYAAVGRLGIKMEGNAAGSSAAVLAELAGLIADGRLEIPIAAVYPLEQVRDAYRELEQRHTRGKIVLVP